MGRKKCRLASGNCVLAGHGQPAQPCLQCQLLQLELRLQYLSRSTEACSPKMTARMTYHPFGPRMWHRVSLPSPLSRLSGNEAGSGRCASLEGYRDQDLRSKGPESRVWR